MREADADELAERETDESKIEWIANETEPVISVSEYRDAACVLLEHACGGEQGRDEDDPIYQEVTEGRDVGAMRKKYSSCGDLAHWLYAELGIRSEFVNRESQGGWRVGKNVSLLAWNELAEQCSPGDHYECGDVVIIWRKPSGQDAHVMCVLGYTDEDPPRLIVAEYGQPGGAIHAHSMAKHRIKGRPLQRVLRLERVLEAAAAVGELEVIQTPEPEPEPEPEAD